MLGPGGFRYLLAWIVVADHVSRLNIGTVAVMAFFMLSGYWVTRVFVERYANGKKGVQVFYMSRFLRIWPIYAVVFLIVYLVALTLKMHLPSDPWIALPIFGVATHGTDILGVTWSLDIELQFYLILPLIVLAMRAAVQTRRTSVLLVAVAVAFWVFGLVLGGRYDVQTALIYLPLFLSGAALHLFDLRADGRMALLSMCTFLIVGVAAVLLPVFRPYVIYGSGSTFADNNFAIVWGLLLLPFVAYNVRRASNRTDRHLGNLSYVLYLVHFPMTGIASALLGRAMTTWEKPVYFVAVFAVSLLIYFLIDAPFETWRHRMLEHVQKTLSFRKAEG